MVSSSLGAGVLALPKAFAIWGILGGSIVETLSAINSLISLKIMCILSAKYPHCLLYTDLCETVIGSKFKKIFNCFMMFYLLGALIAYSLTANILILSL